MYVGSPGDGLAGSQGWPEVEGSVQSGSETTVQLAWHHLTNHQHCDTPARRAGRPEGRALHPKARSRPSAPNWTWPWNARLKDRL